MRKHQMVIKEDRRVLLVDRHLGLAEGVGSLLEVADEISLFESARWLHVAVPRGSAREQGGRRRAVTQ
jgi:hypothetical protein